MYLLGISLINYNAAPCP